MPECPNCEAVEMVKHASTRCCPACGYGESCPDIPAAKTPRRPRAPRPAPALRAAAKNSRASQVLAQRPSHLVDDGSMLPLAACA